jgi:glutaredoxin
VLTIHKIPFEFVDVAADEDALKYMKRRNRGAVGLPQIFTDGEFIGVSTDVVYGIKTVVEMVVSDNNITISINP